jgi:Protein of unknown function (DUF4239)
VRAILNSVPTAWLLAAAAAIAIAVVLPSVVLIRRLVPATREGYHAEISAPMLGVVAALFGLFLAFVIIIAYQNYLSAGSNISRETESLSAIVRDSTAFPDPGGENVRRSVGTYVRAVVNDSWPLMRDGKSSYSAVVGLDDIYAAFRTVHPSSQQETAFYNDAVTQLDTTLAARQDRLESAAGGIPAVILVLLLFNTVVILAYAVFVGSPNFWFHALGPGAIAVVVAVSLVVLVDLSYPFSGSVTVSPEPFKTGILAQFFPRPKREARIAPLGLASQYGFAPATQPSTSSKKRSA